MKGYRVKGFISILLCFVMIIGLSASAAIRADGEVKKVTGISVEYIGKKDKHGNVMAGKEFTNDDFKFKLKHEGS